MTVSDTDERGFLRNEEDESEDSAERRFYLDWHLVLAPHESSASGTAKIDHVRLRCYEQNEDAEPLTLLQYDVNGIVHMTSEDAEPVYRMLIPTGSREHAHRELTQASEAYVEHLEGDEPTRLTCDAVYLMGAIPRQTYALLSIAEAVGSRWWDVARMMVASLSSADSDSPDEQDNMPVSSDVEADDFNIMIQSATEAAQQFHDILDDRGSSRSWIPSMMLQMHFLLSEQFQKDSDLRAGISRGLKALSRESFLNELDNHLSEHSWAQEQVWTPQDDMGEPSIEWSHLIISNFFAGR